jgi:Tfp pilus assembly protein FimT
MRANKRSRGISFLELFIALGIISLTLTMTVSGFQSFYRRMEINNGLRAVTSALSTARYRAIWMNKRVKFTIEEDKIVLKRKESSQWNAFMHFDLEKKVSYSINASPVFSPGGSVSPLCSIYVSNKTYCFKITISMAGRIKVLEID